MIADEFNLMCTSRVSRVSCTVKLSHSIIPIPRRGMPLDVLKVPLTGFMVDGEIVPSSELVVAHGLDITRKNLLALR